MPLIPFDLTQSTRHNVVPDEQGRLRLSRTGTGDEARGEFISAVQDLGAPGQQIHLRWLAQWTAPLRWKKYEGNPIYGPAQSGAWDSWTNGVSIVPNADGNTYKMFYAGTTGEGIGFAEAAIDDPLSWKEHPASPV